MKNTLKLLITIGLLTCGSFAIAETDTGVDVYGSQINYAEWSAETGTKTVWTPTTGKKFVITSWIFSTGTACNMYLLDGDTQLIGKLNFPATSGETFFVPRISGSTNNPLKAWVSASTTGSITVIGHEE